ncbi:uncharacterized protein LOC129316414 [Prosopis cineraria]|uniref:uncharacterized protein LOC129316414 n=1 Tax=Prosopis cineraria TaxID=364024 RepID=UPI00240FF38F|nr:uncharacterized protein LOC129316414 [Prosopis cineraria]XP_054816808.1 uncharacterized protein LOC129316414 [Prosopis cineraria]
MELSPTVAQLNSPGEEHWRHFDNSVSAFPFGFVATAILISLFLLLAIFERFLRQTSAAESAAPTPTDIEDQMLFHTKLLLPSPKTSKHERGVFVLMPGERIPRFIAHPAAVPCPPEPTTLLNGAL